MAPRQHALLVFVGALVAVAGESILPDAALDLDDECAASADGACALNALQSLQALVQTATRGQVAAALAAAVADAPQACVGAWCQTLMAFCKLFDTGNPATMQAAINQYTQWSRDEQGIEIGVTKDHAYTMYHQNVQKKLAEYMPQGKFGWTFGDDFQVQQPAGADSTEVVIKRPGTLTLNLGWVGRQMFWNYAVKPLPDGGHYEGSNVKDLQDCNACPATMLFTLKKGGLEGVGNDWKITRLVLVKMA